MKYIKLTSIFLAVLFTFPFVIHAQVYITEIMYDVPGTDTGREWVEVQNRGTETVDFSTYKLFEANTNHRIDAEGNTSILSGSYVVIADDITKFKIDHPSYSGPLFSSSFSLSNSGEEIAIRTNDGIVTNSVLYVPGIGGAGNNKTLQEKDGVWVEGDPTPGSAFIGNTTTQNETTSSSTLNSDSVNTGTESVTQMTYANSTQATVYTGNDNPDLEISAGRDRLVAIGTPVSFEAKVRSPKTAYVADVRFKWSFGDGGFMTGPFASHTYYFPGEYEVVLNGVHQMNEAAARVRVRVVDTNIVINSADSRFIEIENKSKNELNLGGYFIQSGRSQFIVPQDTLILPGKNLKIPSAVSKISFVENVEIKNPSGNVVAEKQISVIVQDKNLVYVGMSESELRDRMTVALAQYVSPQYVVTPVITKVPEIKTDSAERDVVPQNPILSQTAGVSFVVDREDGGMVSRLMKWIFD